MERKGLKKREYVQQYPISYLLSACGFILCINFTIKKNSTQNGC